MTRKVKTTETGMRRREFLLASGAAVGAAAAGSFVLPKNAYAQSKTEITFASSRRTRWTR
jgi:hypothetical protein